MNKYRVTVKQLYVTEVEAETEQAAVEVGVREFLSSPDISGSAEVELLSGAPTTEDKGDAFIVKPAGLTH